MIIQWERNSGGLTSAIFATARTHDSKGKGSRAKEPYSKITQNVAKGFLITIQSKENQCLFEISISQGLVAS